MSGPVTLDDGIFEGLFKVGVGGLLTLGGWLWKNLVNDVRTLEKDQSAFKLEAERTFAKENTMQATLSRLHDRIDDVSADIKTLIKAVAEK